MTPSQKPVVSKSVTSKNVIDEDPLYLNKIGTKQMKALRIKHYISLVNLILYGQLKAQLLLTLGTRVNSRHLTIQNAAGI